MATAKRQGGKLANQRISSQREGFDYLLLVIVAALLIIGLMMVYSATFDLAYKEYGQPTYFFIRQVLWTAVGVVVLLAMARIEYHHWRRFSVLIMAGTLILLGAVLFIGSERFGAQRSLFKGSIQPSELCKLALVIYVAHWLSSKGDRIRKVIYGLIPFAILIGLVAALIILQPDFSTAVLIVTTALAMFFLAGADLFQLVICFIVGSATFAFLTTRAPYRLARVIAFLDPLGDSYGGGYQVKQTLIALGSGGISGLGLGASRQKFGYLYASHTDGIFAILGEELGLIGCLVVIGLFIALAYRGFKIALEAPDSFGTILASGITCWLIFQALINIAVITATVPFTGIPLPFISFGGSSLAVSMAGIGLMLSVSRGGQQQEEQRKSARHDLGRRHWRPRLSSSGRRSGTKARRKRNSVSRRRSQYRS
jgi:cell division protein FtsW